MKIIGITRVRNVADYILNTLDHVANHVDEIHVYDDASDDATIDFCYGHPAVSIVAGHGEWDSTTKGRRKAEGWMRQYVYESAVNVGADWVYYFDADEYVEFEGVDFATDCYFFRLFDFYITPEDVNKRYLDRQWMGPEFRDIPMLFKVNPKIKFTQRIPRGIGHSQFGGYVKHYGKAISIEDWERKCKYYSEIRWKDNQPGLQERWLKRKGKAIHTISDFGRPLIQWNDRMNEEIIVKL